jgi:hypothetical protein
LIDLGSWALIWKWLAKLTSLLCIFTR